MIREPQVAIAFGEGESRGYPLAPFDPPDIYPELRVAHVLTGTTDPKNTVYTAVRALFERLGFDHNRIGTSAWNPLSELIKKGEHVVIKPNLVYHEHPLGISGVEAMVTHASVVRPIIDYVLLATGKDVRITICDVPLQNANWGDLVERSGFAALCEYYHQLGISIDLLDLRYEVTEKSRHGVTSKRRRVSGDPSGYAVVDLGKASCLYPVAEECHRLEITDYGKGTVAQHHNLERNEYFVAKTVLSGDIIINVAKMKCHRKAAVTLSMKNLIGINGDKSWIAHHRRGVDEYPVFRLKEYLKWYVSYYLKLYAPISATNLVYALYRKFFLGGKSIKQHGMEHGGVLMEGNWYGNDTVWRSILDLNRILLYSDKAGKMTDKRQRRTLAIVDGIVGMELEGPMDGLPLSSNVLVAGEDFAAVDYIASYLMGFDPGKIPQIVRAFEGEEFPLVDFSPSVIKISCPEVQDWKQFDLGYRPSRGWRGYLERRGQDL